MELVTVILYYCNILVIKAPHISLGFIRYIQERDPAILIKIYHINYTFRILAKVVDGL
jgi:hypothetical protein